MPHELPRLLLTWTTGVGYVGLAGLTAILAVSICSLSGIENDRTIRLQRWLLHRVQGSVRHAAGVLLGVTLTTTAAYATKALPAAGATAARAFALEVTHFVFGILLRHLTPRTPACR